MDLGDDEDPGVASGTTLGVRYAVEDGMLSLELGPDDAGPLAEELRRHVRILTSEERPSAVQFESVHRASRMCWEALVRGTISSLDAQDCEILYSVRQEPGVEWVFRILNRVRHLLRTASTTPVEGDHYAKQVSAVMES